MLLAGMLYKQGKLTLGHAVQLVELTKQVFLEVMGKYSFSIVSDSVEDLLLSKKHDIIIPGPKRNSWCSPSFCTILDEVKKLDW